jgi:hypothetical protein
MMKDFDGISSIKDKNRSNKEFGLHFQVVADGIGCVGWLQMVGRLWVISVDILFMHYSPVHQEHMSRTRKRPLSTMRIE